MYSYLNSGPDVKSFTFARRFETGRDSSKNWVRLQSLKIRSYIFLLTQDYKITSPFQLLSIFIISSAYFAILSPASIKYRRARLLDHTSRRPHFAFSSVQVQNFHRFLVNIYISAINVRCKFLKKNY